MLKIRGQILFWFAFLVPLGFMTKFYHGPLSDWVYHYAGDILYPFFWFLVVIFIHPALPPLKTAAWICGITCCLEFTQLIRTPALEQFRQTFLGRTLIGNGFDWYDLGYYFIGGLVALIFSKLILAPADEKKGSHCRYK
jgi:hypothetical protein